MKIETIRTRKVNEETVFLLYSSGKKAIVHKLLRINKYRRFFIAYNLEFNKIELILENEILPKHNHSALIEISRSTVLLAFIIKYKIQLTRYFYSF